jgi:IS5 family transposase
LIAEFEVIHFLRASREASMARRRIGQEAFAFVQEERGRNGRLDAIAVMLDRAPIERLLQDIHAAAKGEPAWPPLALFKALLLGLWHDLSDVALAEALDDRASFRRISRFATSEATPERTAFVRFRRELVARGLDGRLFAAVLRQIKTRGVAVRTGTLVDATVIRQAAKTRGDAAWYVYAGRHRTPAKGYKAHVAADEEGGIVRRIAVTPANVHDARGLALVLPSRPGRVWADTAPTITRRSTTGCGPGAATTDRPAASQAHGHGQGRRPTPLGRHRRPRALPGGEDLRHRQA